MLKISAEQFKRLESRFRYDRRQRLASDLQCAYPGLTGSSSKEKLIAWIDLVIEEGKLLRGTEDNEIVELAALGMLCAVMLSDAERLGLIQRILQDTKSSLRERLDFIRAHLLPELAERL